MHGNVSGGFRSGPLFTTGECGNFTFRDYHNSGKYLVASMLSFGACAALTVLVGTVRRKRRQQQQQQREKQRHQENEEESTKASDIHIRNATPRDVEVLVEFTKGNNKE